MWEPVVPVIDLSKPKSTNRMEAARSSVEIVVFDLSIAGGVKLLQIIKLSGLTSSKIFFD